MVTSLDPQTLEQARRSLASQIQQSGPGEVVEFTRGILTGQVPINQVIGSLTSPENAQQGEAGSSEASGTFPGRMSLGGGSLAGALRGAANEAPSNVQPVADGVGATVGPMDEGPQRMPFMAAPAPQVAPQEVQAKTPPLLREVAPEMAEVLGIDSTQRFRNIDVIRQGFRKIPTDYVGQQRFAADIRKLQEVTTSVLVMGNELASVIQGRPEVLNASLGKLPFVGEVTLPNWASTWAQAKSSFEAVAKNFGWKGFNADPDDAVGQRIQQRAQDLAYKVFGDRPAQERQNLQDAANVNNYVNSLLINMAFMMAATKGQSGRSLSDRDVELQLQELGRTANPEQFLTTIRSVEKRLYDQYNVRMKAQAGREVPLTSSMDEESANIIRTGAATPLKLAQELQAPSATPDPTEPPGLGPRGTIERPFNSAEPSIGGKPGDFVTVGGDLFQRQANGKLIEASPEDRARRIATPVGKLGAGEPSEAPAAPAGPAGPQRQTPTIEQEEAAARGRIEENRAALLAAQSRDQRRLELSESAEARAARNEQRVFAEHRRAEIRAAFAAIAKAFQGSGSASAALTGAGVGGDQDAGAFRVAPNPQRQAPTPVNAAQFRRR